MEPSLDSEDSIHTSSSDDEAEDTNSGKCDSGDYTDGEVDNNEEDNNGKREDCNGVSLEEEVDDNEESMEQSSPSKAEDV